MEDYMAAYEREKGEGGHTMRIARQKAGRLVTLLGSTLLREVKVSDVEAARDRMLEEGTWSAATTTGTGGSRARRVSIKLDTMGGTGAARSAGAVTSTARSGSGSLSPTTVKDTLAFAAQAVDWGMRRDEPVVFRNVFRGVRTPKAERRETEVMTSAEASRLLNVLLAWEPQNRALMLALGLLTGRRVESAFGGLRWCDIDWQAGRITFDQYLIWLPDKAKGTRYSLVHANNHKHRKDAIDVPPLVMDLLRRMQAWHREMGLPDPVWRPLDLVFVGKDGKPIPTETLRAELRRVLAAASIEHHRVHDLRHTAASLLLARGVPIMDVARLCGWKSPQMLLAMRRAGQRWIRTSASCAELLDRTSAAYGCPASMT
jgi:integrase